MHQNQQPVRPVPPLPPPLPASDALSKTTSPRPPATLRRKKRKHPRTAAPRRPAAHLPIRRELSAGGVVLRQQGNEWLVALLKTAHKRGEVWVLPKGHVELQSGERISDAARREVQEEAGLTDLSVKNQLGVTRFKFQAENALVHKTVHYFLMTTQQKTLTPQAEEGLLDAAWFPAAEALRLLAYDTDQEIVQRAWERVEPAARQHKRSAPGGVRKPRRRPLRIHT